MQLSFRSPCGFLLADMCKWTMVSSLNSSGRTEGVLCSRHEWPVTSVIAGSCHSSSSKEERG